jgi:hypothetical protein
MKLTEEIELLEKKVELLKQLAVLESQMTTSDKREALWWLERVPFTQPWPPQYPGRRWNEPWTISDSTTRCL